MPANPKITRETDKEYLDYVRSHACLIGILCYGKVEPHHYPTVGAGGSDYTSVPLCRKHHGEAHQIGRQKFQKKYGLSFTDEQVRLLIGFTRLQKEGSG
jgi:hypothetical protein